MADEDRIRRVARALCAADGHDPEEMIAVGMTDVDICGGVSWVREVIAPAWTSYDGEARRFIATAPATALGLLK